MIGNQCFFAPFPHLLCVPVAGAVAVGVAFAVSNKKELVLVGAVAVVCRKTVDIEVDSVVVHFHPHNPSSSAGVVAVGTAVVPAAVAHTVREQTK